MIPNPSPNDERAGKNGNGAALDASEPSEAYLTAVATYEAAAAERRTLSPVNEAQLVAGLSSREIARLAQAKQVIERLYAARSGTPRSNAKVDTDAPPADESDTQPTATRDSAPDHAATTVSVRPSGDVAGTRLGRFEIIREIGRGGHGVVFLARDPVLGRQVALKTPRPEMLLTPQMKRRFLREGKAAALLNHPNLLTVFEAGEAGPICWLAQAYCPGVTLAAWLREQAGPVAPRRAARIVAELAAGVEHAHARGVLHRDIKPSNVLLEPHAANGEPTQATAFASTIQATAADEALPFTPKLTDFGLAKVLEPDAEHTATGTALGTPAYMPPEQAAGRGDQIGPAADVYGLGAILYELLTGRVLFSGNSHGEMLHKVVTEEPAAPRSLVPRLPRDLEAICLRCLEKEPQRRYPTAQQLADDLGRFLRGEPTLARPIGLAERTAKWLRRHPVRVLVLLLAATILAGGAWGKRAYDQQQAMLAREAKTAIRHEADSIDERYPREAQAAHAAIVRLNYDEAREHLQRCEPKLSQAAPTGFAWEFLRSQAASDHRILRGHEGNVYGVGYAPDGSWLASAGADRTLRLWETDSGRLLATLTGHEGEINALAVSPDGRWIATAGDDRAVKIWDALKIWNGVKTKDAAKVRDAAECLHKTLNDATDAVGSVAFSPDGRQLATGSHDKTLRVYDTEIWQLVFNYQAHSDWVETLEFYAAESILFSSDVKGGTVVWRTSPWSIVAETPEDNKRRIVASHRSRVHAYVVAGKEVEVWDNKVGNNRPRLVGHRERINALAFTADDDTLISASRDATLRIWDAETQACRVTMELDAGEVWTVATSPTERQCAAGCADGSIHLLNLAGLYDRRRLRGLPASTEAIAMDGAGRVLATATTEAEIFVWDAATWDLLHVLDVPTGHARGLALSRDGQSLAAMVDDSQEGIVVLHNLKSGAHAERRVARSQIGRIYFAEEDQRLLVVHEQGLECLDKNLEPTDGPVPEMIEGILVSSLSADGRLLALGLADKTARLFDLEQPHGLIKFEGLREAVHAVAISPDGKLMAAGDDKGQVAIWDIATRTALVDFDAHAGTVQQLAFHPAGRELASTGADGQCRLWRVPYGALLLSLDTGKPIGDSLLFSPDGRKLIATAHANGDEGSVCIWSASAHRGGEAVPVVPRTLRDVPVSEATRRLVNWQRDRQDKPPTLDWFMRHLQWWAVEQGYGAAIPTFRYAGYHGTLLTEVLLLKRENVGHVQLEAENPKIDQGKEFPEMNRRANLWAQEHGAAGGLLDFGRTRTPPHPDWHFQLLDNSAIERRDVPARELDDTCLLPRQRMRLLSAWAIRHGYLGAFPTWQDREEGGQQLLGALCVKPEAAERSWFVIGE